MKDPYIASFEVPDAPGRHISGQRVSFTFLIRDEEDKGRTDRTCCGTYMRFTSLTALLKFRRDLEDWHARIVAMLDPGELDRKAVKL